MDAIGGGILVSMARRRWLRRILLGVAMFLAACGIGLLVLWATLPDVRPLRDHNPETTAFIELRKRQAAEEGKPFALHYTWRPLRRISPFLRRALVHAEDARFFQHDGVDWDAVKKTIEQDLHEGSLARGGSTITQQVAKNLYLSPSRNPIRKLRELFIAWRLEAALGKERILEIYLNIAEWGPGVFGAEAAARHWFGRSAGDLTAAQAARLAVALPNPLKRSPRIDSRALDRKAAALVRALARGGLLDEGALDEALRDLHQGSPRQPAPVEPAPAERAPPPPVPASPEPDEDLGVDEDE
jgi:monofunctional biosynthetic peptidoglycan transglycosylase